VWARISKIANEVIDYSLRLKAFLGGEVMGELISAIAKLVAEIVQAIVGSGESSVITPEEIEDRVREKFQSYDDIVESIDKIIK
jgi:hypothetical protein